MFLSQFVTACDVRLAQGHEVVDVVVGIVYQPSHSAVSHHLVSNGYGAHVQVDKFLHIFHLHVQRQFEPSEDIRQHLCPDVVVVVESPSVLRVPSFGLCLADVMEQCRPSEP